MPQANGIPYPKMPLSLAKVRHGPAGLHYFNRNSGLNILLEEAIPQETCWHAAPRQISIALTNTCDLSCPYCYAPKNHAVLAYEQVCSWLCEFDQNGALGVGFGGGEPTLHPSFAKYCEFATNSTQLAVTFTTHGHHLKPKLLSRLEGNVNFIRLSMDGVQKTYERLRRKSFTEFTTRLRDARSIAPFGLNFVVNEDTINDLEAAITFAHAEGAKEFLLLPEQPTTQRQSLAESELKQLQLWVDSYKGDIPLSISETEAHSFGTCDPCAAETGLRAYAHITAMGHLQRTSFAPSGVPITKDGAIVALEKLKQTLI